MHGLDQDAWAAAYVHFPAALGATACVQASEFQGKDLGAVEQERALFSLLHSEPGEVGMEGRLPRWPGPILGRPAPSGFGPHRAKAVLLVEEMLRVSSQGGGFWLLRVGIVHWVSYGVCVSFTSSLALAT